MDPGSLRILHADTADSWRGGQAQALALLEGLAARGHHQWLAAPEGPLAERARAQGVETHAWRPRGDLDLPAAWRLRGLARALRPDVVHLHSARAHATGWWAARASGAACVVARRVDFEVARHPLSALKYRLPVDRFVTVSHGIQEVLARSGVPAARVRVIHSGIDVRAIVDAVERARAEGRSAALRRSFGVPEGAPWIGIIAALAPHKDHVTFLEAARRVADTWPDARFVCAGDGPLAASVRARVESLGLTARVALPGFVEDVPALLGALDVFVLSSYLEGLGTSVLDAQAAGVPVVATCVGGVPEMVADGETGILVPARDPKALGLAIGRVLADPEGARARATRARGTVEAFDVARTVEQTEALYRELLAERKAAS